MLNVLALRSRIVHFISYTLGSRVQSTYASIITNLSFLADDFKRYFVINLYQTRGFFIGMSVTFIII